MPRMARVRRRSKSMTTTASRYVVMRGRKGQGPAWKTGPDREKGCSPRDRGGAGSPDRGPDPCSVPRPKGFASWQFVHGLSTQKAPPDTIRRGRENETARGDAGSRVHFSTRATMIPPRFLSQVQIQKLLVALGWTRDTRPFRDADMEAVYIWALDPQTPSTVVGSVLRGETAIDHEGGRIVTWPRKAVEVKRIRKALR